MATWSSRAAALCSVGFVAGIGCLYACATSSSDDTPTTGGPEGGSDTSALTCSKGKLCDGGCIDPLNDPNNCNTCGHTCSMGFACKAGSCIQVTCNPPATNCADSGAAKCVDLSMDTANCGMCGNVCDFIHTCEAGTCNFNCMPPTSGCEDDAGGSCVDLTQDNNNCGKCGVICPMAATCTMSACVCPMGQTLCGSDCVDTTSDNSNCGKCGTTCTGSMQCVASNCVNAPTQSTIFVSSKVYSGGALGGLSGADTTCQALATAASLSGSYRAWLSDSKTDASSRFAHWGTPYYLVDGTTKVASDWSGLTGTVLHAIDQTEKGGAPPVGSIEAHAVWTNTKPSGVKLSTTDCTDWTSLSGTVNSFNFGESNLATGAWTQNSSSSFFGSFCGSTYTAALYCLSQ